MKEVSMQKPETRRVLGIVGSPRRGGNTEILVDQVLLGAEEAGAITEKAILAELDIAPCEACAACEDTGECTIADDMEDLLQKMAGSDIWVLGTPVYWWGPSAQFKLFLDRWYSKSFLAEDKAMFKGRRIIVAIAMGDSDQATARHTVGMLSDAISYLEAELFGTVLAPGVSDAGEVRQRSDVLAEAHRLGMEAVRRS
jgi:multimeric flavodoxin WrbA